MTALGERLAQMGETAAKTATVSGSPWHHKRRSEYAVFGPKVVHAVLDADRVPLVESAPVPPDACRDEAFAAISDHIATFSPDVAAALVAVAEAADGLEDCPFCRLPQDVHLDACPLGRLAKALGVLPVEHRVRERTSNR